MKNIACGGEVLVREMGICEGGYWTYTINLI